MLDAINRDTALFGICARACEENEITVEVCAALLRGDDLDDERVRILKVDKYYATAGLAEQPKSIDCLIVVKCASGAFELTLVELRNVSSTKGVPPSVMIEKFRNTFERFMAQDFGHIFANPDYSFARIRAWLVTDPFNMPHLSDEEYRRKIGTTRLKTIQSADPFEFRGHRVPVETRRPGPPLPEVCTC
jgi:hypothetical protein